MDARRGLCDPTPPIYLSPQASSALALAAAMALSDVKLSSQRYDGAEDHRRDHPVDAGATVIVVYYSQHFTAALASRV